MPRPDSDRAMRRMAADLASLHADDLAGVMAALDPGERAAIAPLLREYALYSETPERKPSVDIAGLSPWLASKLEGDEGAGAMTPHAQHALRESAAALFPPPGTPSPGSRGPRNPPARTLFGRRNGPK